MKAQLIGEFITECRKHGIADEIIAFDFEGLRYYKKYGVLKDAVEMETLTVKKEAEVVIPDNIKLEYLSFCMDRKIVPDQMGLSDYYAVRKSGLLSEYKAV